MPHRLLLSLLVFTGGTASLGIEMAASRLLAPYFGTSLLIWANLIGLILVYLALGYWLGGRLADRHPDPGLLYSLSALAGMLVGLIPFVAQPILRASQQSFFDASAGLFVGSLLATLALFSLPVILLGMISPFAIRLRLSDTRAAGAEVGGLYALSTLGSIVGVFLPVLVLIPTIGARRTFLLFALALLLVSLSGLLFHARRRASLGAGAGLASLLVLEVIAPGGAVRPQAGLLFEGESPYHYIQVFETGHDRWLALNEGQALHSWYNPDATLSGGIWDLFLLAPLFAPGAASPTFPGFLEGREGAEGREEGLPFPSLALIGLAAGTVARQYTAAYGPIPIVGVEIDPLVVEVGRDYFDLTLPNLQPVVADGRAWLQGDSGQYAVIAVDAYRQPYIPFHLTTVEFFTLARDRLTDNGVVVINVGHNGADFRLVDALASTLRQVFPSVYVIAPDRSFNSLLVATRRTSTLQNYQANLTRLDKPLVGQVAQTVEGRVWLWDGEGRVLTDDHAPVEQITDQMIVRYALGP